MQEEQDPCSSGYWPANFPGAAYYDESVLFPWPVEDSMNGFSCPLVPVLSAEDKAASVSKNHSQAEKRRRDRINAQLGVLRKLIPRSDKMDKAALLESAIDQVKELKIQAKEISKAITIPTEFDEVTVDNIGDSDDVIPSTSTAKENNNIYIRASICCDDRPEVFSELIRALNGLRLNLVRAEISSVGGRVKSILILCNEGGRDDGGGGGGVSLSAIKQSLNVVLSRISSSSIPSNYHIRSKRQRFFLPSQ
ncbi:transcription factor bHLH51 [Mercurialis annua]|uniref:transcription factor bHLH51 n=1 Tax=Mercurialis annua TaxID=3986 RepID=UPI00215F317C|nr:transcription factor bHLH51 [Mercurialis annua]